jgi:hypothetical protein
MPPEAILATLRHLGLVLQRLNLPYALMGGLALSFWKHPRFTKDVDVLAALGATSVETLLESLTASGFRPKRADPRARLTQAEFLQLLYEPPGTYLEVQVDLLLACDPYQLQSLQRRLSATTSELGFDVAVLACEDLILYKLLAGRALDVVDATAVLRANRGSIDLAYLLHWVQAQELDADFARIWSEAFPGEPVPHPTLDA